MTGTWHEKTRVALARSRTWQELTLCDHCRRKLKFLGWAFWAGRVWSTSCIRLGASGAHGVPVKSQFLAEILVGLGAASEHDLWGTPGRSAKAATQSDFHRWRSMDVFMFQFEQWDVHWTKYLNPEGECWHHGLNTFGFGHGAYLMTLFRIWSRIYWKPTWEETAMGFWWIIASLGFSFQLKARASSWSG